MTDIHLQPISERVDWLFSLAKAHGDDFSSPGAALARRRYLAQHPTAVAVLKCMDGRVNMPVATGSPIGILTGFRNLGGVFDLGWPHLGEVFSRWVERAADSGRRVLALVTYHYSRGSEARGCAGFGCDTSAARAEAYRIATQIEAMFGGPQGTVCAIVCGFETDLDALVLHGETGEALDLADVAGAEALPGALARLFPHAPEAVLRDLLPLLLGNLDHVAEQKAALERGGRELDIEHREWVICLGRGFDFLRTPNTALIIGPFSPNLSEPVATAARIIRGNMQAGRIGDDGFLVLSSAPYEELGPDRARAAEKSRFLARFAAETVAAHAPDLAPLMRVESRVLDWRSRRLETP